jgi:hypothetical protein
MFRRQYYSKEKDGRQGISEVKSATVKAAYTACLFRTSRELAAFEASGAYNHIQPHDKGPTIHWGQNQRT